MNLKTDYLLKISFLVIVVAGLFMLNSCRDDDFSPPKKGKLQVNISTRERSGGRTKSDSEPASIRLTIEDTQGNIVLNLDSLFIYPVGQGYVSESLELPIGHYVLTQFLVFDENGESIYLAPMFGSELASLVDHPLPINFSITENGSSEVAVDVIPVDETDTPEKFGYGVFSFNIVKPVKDITFNLHGFVRERNFTKTPVNFGVKVVAYKYNEEFTPVMVWSDLVSVGSAGASIVLKDSVDEFSFEVNNIMYKDFGRRIYVGIDEITGQSHDVNFYLTPKSKLQMTKMTADIAVGPNYWKSVHDFTYTPYGLFKQSKGYVKPAGEIYYAETFTYDVTYNQHAIPSNIHYKLNSGPATWETIEAVNPHEEYPTTLKIRKGDQNSVLDLQSVLLTWANEKISAATIYRHASDHFSHQYSYDANGNVTLIKIYDANGYERYSVTMQYNDQRNSAPIHSYQGWVLGNLIHAHSDLIIMPFVLGGPLNELVYMQVDYSHEGQALYSERVTYQYSTSVPRGLDVTLEYQNFETGETFNSTRQMNTTFTTQ